MRTVAAAALVTALVVATSSASAAAAAPAPLVPLPAYPLEVDVRGGEGTVTSSPAVIDCGAACTGTFSQGTVVTLTATPAAGSAFHSWGGVCSGSASTCKVTMSAAATVTALFDPVRLTVVTSGSGGWITSSGDGSVDGIDCGVPATCSATFPVGTAVKLWAIRSATGALESWTGCASATSVLCSLTMNGDATVTATFSALALLIPVGIETNVSLSTSGAGSGEVAISPPGTTCQSGCTKRYPVGVRLQLTATAGAGSAFGGWSGACGGATGSTCKVTVAPDLSLGASFVHQPAVGGGPAPDPGGGGGGETGEPGTDPDATASGPIVDRLRARLLGRGGRRLLRIDLDLNRAGTANVRLRQIGTRRVLERRRVLREGRNVIVIRIPARRPPGRQRLTVVVVDGAGKRQTVSAVLRLRR